MLRKFRTPGLFLLSAVLAASLCAPSAYADNARKVTIHRVLVDIYEKQHDAKSAMSEYIILDRMAPSDAQLQYNFGIFLARQKEHQLAITHLKKATQLDGSVTDYWVQLANECLQARNFLGAANAFHSAGPKYAPQEQGARQYLLQMKQYDDYQKQLKDQQE